MVNDIGREELNRLTAEIWSSMLGIELLPTDTKPEVKRKVSAVVQIIGEWEGAVCLNISDDLARLAAATFIGAEPGEVEAEQIRDAAGELSNMTGGSLKALLPKPCKLSLPSVADGVDFELTVQNCRLALESTFAAPEGSLVVSVFERTE